MAASNRSVGSKEPSLAPPDGKVLNVKSQWRVHEDGVLAHKLQEEEFGAKYDWNRKDRKTARKDVPLARVCQSEEEERLQRERMLQLEELRMQSVQDAAVAQQVYKEELEKINTTRSRADADAAVARQAQEEETRQSRIRISSTDFDSAMVHRMQEDDDHDRRMRELKDQELAVQLQEKERRKYEIRKQQKDLARQRKDIEYVQKMESGRILGENSPAQEPQGPRFDRNSGSLEAGIQNVNLGGPTKKVLRPDGKLEDLGDFSDFYIQPSSQMAPTEKKELQELQDEELARLLQDQEHKRGATVDRDRMKEIEERDAELARVMMEQEKLKVLKRKEAKQRQLQLRQMSEPGGPTQQPPRKSHPSRGDSMPAGHPVYDDQNHYNERMRGSVERVPPIRSDNDGSSGGIRALNRQMPPQNVVNGQSPDQTIDRDPHYQSHYGQRPLPATPDTDGLRGRSPNANGRPPSEGQYSHSSRGANNEIPQSQRPVRSPSPDEDASEPPVPSNNVIASIDPTFKRDRDMSDPPPLQPAPSPPQTVNRHPPTTEYENLPSPNGQRSKVTSGGEDSYCDLDDLQNFTPVQGQRRNAQKKEGKKSGSKKDKNCKQQ